MTFRGSPVGRGRALCLAIGLAMTIAGCDGASTPAADVAAKDPLRHRPSDELDLGKSTYERYCVGCHGENGDGKGEAALFLFPPPRDFTQGVYKFTTTPSGSLPTDDDLLRTITYGLRGTAMPSFRYLSTAEKEAVIAYLKTFFADWATYPPSSTVSRHANPFEMDPEFPEERQEAVVAGEEIYHGKAECWKCHPVYASAEKIAEIKTKFGTEVAREDPDKPVLKEDFWKQFIPPPEFKTMKLKSVRGLQDLYRVIAAGVGGTAMPTWEGSLSGAEIWSLVLYVDSLVQQGKDEKRARVAALLEQARRQ